MYRGKIPHRWSRERFEQIPQTMPPYTKDVIEQPIEPMPLLQQEQQIWPAPEEQPPEPVLAFQQEQQIWPALEEQTLEPVTIAQEAPQIWPTLEEQTLQPETMPQQIMQMWPVTETEQTPEPESTAQQATQMWPVTETEQTPEPESTAQQATQMWPLTETEQTPEPKSTAQQATQMWPVTETEQTPEPESTAQQATQMWPVTETEQTPEPESTAQQATQMWPIPEEEQLSKTLPATTEPPKLELTELELLKLNQLKDQLLILSEEEPQNTQTHHNFELAVSLNSDDTINPPANYDSPASVIPEAKSEHLPKPARLSQPAAAKTNSTKLICGKNAVMEALRSGQAVNRVLIAEGQRGAFTAEILKKCHEKGILYQFLPKARLSKIAGPDHRGVALELSNFSYAEVDDILALAQERGEQPLLLLLDGVEDPHNLGAVMRTALCAGAHGIIIPKRRSVSFTATVAKTSAGASAHLPLARVSNLNQTAQTLKQAGLWLAAADMDGHTAWESDLSGPLALVLGGEGGGISPLLKQHCDICVSLPMEGPLSSLNVSATAAALLYEIKRQRKELGGWK